MIKTFVENVETLIVGQVGVRITFYFSKANGAVMDISSASVKKCRILRGDGTSIDKTLTFDTNGVNGVAYYQTVAGDLNSKGLYTAEGYVEFAAGLQSPSLPVRFRVIERIPAPAS